MLNFTNLGYTPERGFTSQISAAILTITGSRNSKAEVIDFLSPTSLKVGIVDICTEKKNVARAI